MRNFEDAVMLEITNNILKDLDKMALAKKLRPQVEKRLEKAIINYFDDDTAYEILTNSNISKLFKHALNEVIEKLVK